MSDIPRVVVADSWGRIFDVPGTWAAGRSTGRVDPLNPEELIALPACSQLFYLPGRYPMGFDGSGTATVIGRSYQPVAAFLPPGYLALRLCAFERAPGAPVLPFYSYAALAWFQGRLCVAAIRVDYARKHNLRTIDWQKVRQRVRDWLRRNPQNRLLAHHGRVCALRYRCANAANLFLQRWEAPLAVASRCNATCLGCLSLQPHGASVPSSHERIRFVPTVAEMVDVAVPHLERARGAMVSFGQGCEGEPLLYSRRIEAAIRAIRRQTRRGTIHLNTNGSNPRAVSRLMAAGLDSIRVSLNSAREALYAAYFRCRSYSLRDVVETLRIARAGGLWVSLNYLSFPGVSDDPAEFRSLERLLAQTQPHMIQWRNLNIDPDVYEDRVKHVIGHRRQSPLGMAELLRRVRAAFPNLRFGCFNPPVLRTCRSVTWRAGKETIPG